MIARTLPGLCLRPALAVTVAILAALGSLIVWVEGAVGDAPNGALVFQIAYNVLVAAIVISLGSFTGKVTEELKAIRIARTVPGLRRKMSLSVGALAPGVAALAVGAIAWTVPMKFRSVAPVAQGGLYLFLFCLGLGLGWSRLLPIAVFVLASQHGFVSRHLRETPVAFTGVALAGAAALAAVWHARFLRPAGTPWFGSLAWLKTEAPDALSRRTGEPLREAADWNENTPRLTLGRLLRAGVYERLGHRFGALTGAVARSVAGIYGFFALFLAVFALKAPGGDPRQFCVDVFTSATPDRWVAITRISFAAITGMAAFVATVTLNTALRPNLWHPVSRRMKARIVFWSRVRQNTGFALAHLFIAGLLVAGGGLLAGKWPDAAAWRAFMGPALAAFLLAPIPQALFPHGIETFHAKASPLVQLGAGLLGGLFCLVTVYWTAHWPATELQAWMTPLAQAVLFVGAVIGSYAAYGAWVTFRYTRIDLSRRAL